MLDTNVKADLMRFGDCQDQAAAKELMEELCKPFYAITTQFKKARSARVKELRIAELQPFHEMACRWKPGQKVYFAHGLDSCSLNWSFRPIKGSERKIKAGDWCRVYQYQTRAKRLWLCKPGKPYNQANLMNACFSVREIMELGISRTELAIRN